jgi:hypothetical protein
MRLPAGEIPRYGFVGFEQPHFLPVLRGAQAINDRQRQGKDKKNHSAQAPSGHWNLHRGMNAE